MGPRRVQVSVAGLLGLVAGSAVCVWLFRLGMFWGILGLSVVKHVVVAYLCQVLGVDRREHPDPGPAAEARAAAPGHPVAAP
jgi:hypothetical protein